MNLFDANDEDERFSEWKERGNGTAIWGSEAHNGDGSPSPLNSGSVPVCRCQMDRLSTWFQKALMAIDIDDGSGAQGDFRAFMERLKSKERE